MIGETLQLFLSNHQSPIIIHLLCAKRLCFCSGSKLLWNRADKQRFQSELEKNCPNLAQAQCCSVELEVYKIMVCIDLVVKTCNWLELKVQLQDFVQVTQTPCIDFQFDHNSRERSGLTVCAQLFSVSLVCTKRKAAIKDVHLNE